MNKYVTKKECVQTVVTETKEGAVSYVKPNKYTVFISKGVVVAVLMFFASIPLCFVLEHTAYEMDVALFTLLCLAASVIFIFLLLLNWFFGIGSNNKNGIIARSYVWQDIVCPSKKGKTFMGIATLVTLILISIIAFSFGSTGERVIMAIIDICYLLSAFIKR